MPPFTYISFVGACWFVVFAVWLISSFTAKRSVGSFSRPAGGILRLAVFGVVAFAMASGGARFAGAHLTAGPIAVLGCALALGGAVFAIWARFALGRNWGMPMTLREEPELVTSGPYRYVRHPIYTGLLAALIGSALVQTAFVWPAVISAAYFALSAPREERDMLKQFPSQYPAYRQRTKMFIPFVL